MGRSARALALAASWLLASASGCLVMFPLDDAGEALKTGKGGTATSAGHAGTAALSSGVGGEAASSEGGAAGQTSPAGGRPGTCQTQADCIALEGNGDEAYRCRSSDHTCVTAKGDTCPVVRGSFEDPNAIYIGAFGALDAVEPGSSPIVLAHQLALEELAGDGNRGLPNGPGGVRRPIVMVVCDNSDELVEAGVAHLIDDLEVPAILATIKPGPLFDSFDAHRKSGVFYLSPVSVTQSIVNDKDDGLIWNLLGQPSDFVPAYAKLLTRTEQYLRDPANGAVADGEALRVALVTTKDAFDAELSNKIQPALRFNGQSIIENGGNFKGFTLDAADPGLEDAIVDIIKFRPHVVVSAASEVVTMQGGVLSIVEKYWKSPLIEGASQARPTYLLSPYNAGDLDTVMGLIASLYQGHLDNLPERRFFGLSIADAPNPDLLNKFKSRLGIRFKDAYNQTNNYYDAFYFLAYAMYGAGTDEPLSGKGIARGMQRLLSGESYPVGPDDIDKVYAALDAQDSTITLNSTVGAPNFDVKTGVRPIDAGFFCFTRMGAQVAYDLDARRFDRSLADFTGSGPLCTTGLLP